MKKCYGKGPKMESAKQQKKNLMTDMPVVEKGMAMYDKAPAMKGSFMSKHCNCR